MEPSGCAQYAANMRWSVVVCPVDGSTHDTMIYNILLKSSRGFLLISYFKKLEEDIGDSVRPKNNF